MKYCFRQSPHFLEKNNAKAKLQQEDSSEHTCYDKLLFDKIKHKSLNFFLVSWYV